MASTFVGDLEPPDLHRAALRFRTAACTFSARARCDCLTRSLSLWQQRAALRNSLAEAKRSRVWQIGLGSGIDSFEFHDRARAGKRNRRIVDAGSRQVRTARSCRALRCAWRIEKNSFVRWLWGNLQAEFGFRKWSPVPFKKTCAFHSSKRAGLSFFLKHFYRFPCFVRRRLFVFKRAGQIHLGQQIVRIKFQET